MRVLGHDEGDEDCPHCRGTGQPGGVRGGPEHGVCSWCHGSGKTQNPRIFRGVVQHANLLAQYESAHKMMLEIRQKIVSDAEAKGQKVTIIDDLIIIEENKG